MVDNIRNKRVFVTGCAGTVGSELVHQLLSDDDLRPSEVVGIDINEGGLFFQDQKYLSDSRANFYLADVRDRIELTSRMEGADIVFHTAAYKHVIMTERSPQQAVETNVIGTQNVIGAAKDCQVEKVIFTSSDKAVNPTSVMGTSKLMGERLITAANSSKRAAGPIFASTRFGNVLGSSGSVIPIFHNQISQGGPVTVTDRGMTRFVMSIEQAVSLIIQSSSMAKGGEVFITKMPVISIMDLAKVMIEELSQKYGHLSSSLSIDEIGIKPGEKIYEELMSAEETRRAIELKDYFCVLPAYRGVYQEIEYKYEDLINENVTNPYISSSEALLSHTDIGEMLLKYNLLGKPAGEAGSRYWPGDKETKS